MKGGTDDGSGWTRVERERERERERQKGGESRGLQLCSTEIRTRADLPRGVGARGGPGRSPLRLPSTDGGDTARRTRGDGDGQHTHGTRGGDKSVGGGGAKDGSLPSRLCCCCRAGRLESDGRTIVSER